ncbi:hypothetical protein CH75_06350 [Dyella jiangningensis]|nr:hypothetical protein CH75_06350 [Dyella jiangningensis]
MTKVFKAKDPLRLWLQQTHAPICCCDHCFEIQTKGSSSPIETMMENAIAFARKNSYDDARWEFHREWPVHEYQADFVLLAPAFMIVIECDGHDYHERTKEQAAHDRKRDRAMTVSGITVLRYTGSEIWRNPFACAEQVISLALSMQVQHDLQATRP